MPVRLPSEFRLDMLRQEAKDAAATTAAFGTTTARVQETFLVDASSEPQDETSWFLNDMVATILGTSYVQENVDSNHFRRITPLRHPLWPSLYAESIVSIVGEGPSMGILDPDPNMFEYDEVVSWARWRQFRVTVSFGMPTYRVMTDAELVEKFEGSDNAAGMERFRYVTPEVHPDIEVISLSTGEFGYAEIPDGETAIPDARVSGEQVAIIPKATYSFHWKDVPMEWISPGSSSLGTRGLRYPMLDKIGTVNSQSFFVTDTDATTALFPPGTMLMLPPTITRKPSPLFQKTQYGVVEQIVLADVELKFAYFDPPRAKALSTERGHCLMPWRGNRDTANGVKYILGTRSGTPTGSRLFDSYDHNKLFGEFDRY